MVMYILGVATVIMALAYQIRLRWLIYHHGLHPRPANARTASEFAAALALAIVIALIIFGNPNGAPL